MGAQQVALTLVSSLLSGLLGVAISTAYYRRFEHRRVKLDTLTRLLGFRFDIGGDEFSRALNEVFVVFHDSPEVLRALQDFHDVTVSRQSALANDRLMALLKALCRDARVNPAGISDSFYLMPFNMRV